MPLSAADGVCGIALFGFLFSPFYGPPFSLSLIKKKFCVESPPPHFPPLLWNGEVFFSSRFYLPPREVWAKDPGRSPSPFFFFTSFPSPSVGDIVKTATPLFSLRSSSLILGLVDASQTTFLLCIENTSYLPPHFLRNSLRFSTLANHCPSLCPPPRFSHVVGLNQTWRNRGIRPLNVYFSPFLFILLPPITSPLMKAPVPSPSFLILSSR